MSKQLECWAQNLSLKDRLKVQKFMVKIYSLELNNKKEGVN